MNIFWIYRWFKERSKRSKGSKGSRKFKSSKGSRNVQRSSIVQCVQGTFKSSKGSRVQKVQCVQGTFKSSRVQLIKRTINTFNWFKEVQRFGERSIRSRVQKVQALEIILIHSNQTFTQSYAAK
jgi:hypothetical protein